MIECYCGYPGHGKTLALTYRAYKAMKQKRLVFTNYPVKGAYRITFDDLIEYAFPKGSVVIIDESGRWFNSRKWKDLPPEVFDLFTLHRHMQLDLIVAVQNFNRIDIALREVIELVWWASNKLWSPVIVYYGYYDVENLGMKGEHNLVSYISRWTRARKLYDTHAMSRIIDKLLMPLIPWTNDSHLETGGGEGPEGSEAPPVDQGEEGQGAGDISPEQTIPDRESHGDDDCTDEHGGGEKVEELM